MAKKSSVAKNKKRERMAVQFAGKRRQLKAQAKDETLSPEDRFRARLKRVRNRCELTGRPRAVYRKFKLSRIALRELGSKGQIPGLVKSSW